MKTYALLDDGELFGGGFHLRHIVGKILRFVAAHGKPDGAVVNANAVSDLAAKQFVDRQSSSFPGEIPEGHFDGADRAAPGFEAAALADAQHDPFDVCRVLVNDRRL